MTLKKVKSKNSTGEDGGKSPPTADDPPGDSVTRNTPQQTYERVCMAVIARLMNLVNDLELDMPPRVMEGVELGSPRGSSHDVVQRATVYRRKLLEILVMFGVEVIDQVGCVVDYSRHNCISVITTNYPELHKTVAVCLLTGFSRGGVVARPALVEVFHYNPPEENAAEEEEKEQRHAQTQE